MEAQRTMLSDVLDAINALGDAGRVAVKFTLTSKMYAEELFAALRRTTRAKVARFDENAPLYAFDVAVEVETTGVYSWSAKVIRNRRGPVGACGLFVIDREGWSAP